jgi:hypothetical protein
MKHQKEIETIGQAHLRHDAQDILETLAPLRCTILQLIKFAFVKEVARAVKPTAGNPDKTQYS